MKVLTIKLHVDVLEKQPLVMRENVSSGKLYDDPITLDREIHGDVHYMGWRGKVYEIKLSNILSAIGAEVQGNEN